MPPNLCVYAHAVPCPGHSTKGTDKTIWRRSAVHGQGCCTPRPFPVPRSAVRVTGACCQACERFQG